MTGRRVNGSSGWGFVLVAVACAIASEAAAQRSAKDFWPNAGISAVAVSPNGRWIAASAHRGDDQIVLVQEVGRGRVASLLTTHRLGTVAWEAPDALAVEATNIAGDRRTHLFRLRSGIDSIQTTHVKLNVPGWLVDPLPTEPDRVLWQFEYRGWTTLHRVSIQDLLAYRRLVRYSVRATEIAERLATIDGWAHPDRWVIDRSGRPRAALRETEKGYALMLPAHGTGPLESVHLWSHSESARAIEPVGLASDGEGVVVSAYQGHATRGLFELDPKSGRIGRELFRDDRYDVAFVVSEPATGELIAAAYYRSGDLRFHYFETFRERLLAKLPVEWRNASTRIGSAAADRETIAFLIESATNPGEHFVRDSTGKVSRIGRFAENVDSEALVPVESFSVESKDGLEIEAFLALPRDRARPAPLLVMPHGGPIDVADNRHYDPMVQYFASWGFGVLQVNYRGSAGYGRDFVEAGKRERARGIEDDIDAVVDAMMTRPEIDGTRMCIIGASYGGFSALASVVRHRDRYRCAVSLNGVSDVLLQYDSSEAGDSELSVDFYKEYWGDPERDRAELIEASPAYHVDRIGVPVLVAYATKDRRVDPDNSHRMLLMLELHGKPHEYLELKGGTHHSTPDELIVFVRAARRFLSEHLMPEGAHEPDPGARSMDGRSSRSARAELVHPEVGVEGDADSFAEVAFVFEEVFTQSVPLRDRVESENRFQSSEARVGPRSVREVDEDSE